MRFLTFAESASSSAVIASLIVWSSLTALVQPSTVFAQPNGQSNYETKLALRSTNDAVTQAATITEIPAAADSLANSVGVNISLASLPTKSVPQLALLTKQLGTRHVRVPLLKNDPPYNAIVNKFLSISGAHALGETDCPLPLGNYASAGIVAADVQTFQVAIGGRLEAYEAVNEPDKRMNRDLHWAADTIACIKHQIGAVKGLPFLAPAIANENEYATQLGNLSALVDRGNIHRYFSGRNPATNGWGNTNACGVYGALDWAKCEAAITAGSWPSVMTETGYDSVKEVNETTQAKYLSREIFINFQAGILRTFIYSLNSYTGADGFGGMGLLELNLVPKPSFVALAHELALFSDRGRIGSRTPLAYSVATQVATIRHALFQKSDGTYLLSVWNEISSWEPNGGGEIAVPSTSVEVSLPFSPNAINVEALDDHGNFKPTNFNAVGGAFTFPVDDHVTVFAFRK